MILIILECASAIQKLTLLEYPEAHTTGIQKKKNGSALSNNESNPFSSMFFFLHFNDLCNHIRRFSCPDHY